MGFFFRKSVKVGPIRLNLSKSGVGASVGVKGLRFGVKSNGKKYVHAGRKGLYYRKDFSSSNIENSDNFEMETKNDNEIVFVENRQEIEGEYKSEKLKNSFFLYFLLVPFGFIPVIGAIYWWYVALRNLFKKSVKFYYNDSVPVYVRDRRYKTGRRIDGYRDTKVYTNIRASLSTKERVLFVFKGVIAMLFASQLIVYNYNIFLPTEDVGIYDKTKVGIVTPKVGLNLREDGNVKSNILTQIPFNEKVEILESEIKNGEWLYVKYENDSGWVSKKFLNIDHHTK
ncbi:DUF4236 domain-containing protein [Flammeovirga sp. MY04]|uniref:DUF4236 domain-containing protein n=1 Tax=Flammeovirga sp. MY04 TaxID=1191459 RepID=UPI0008061444|nr:DUF4236 domain-containing protein [Flammeovirga sp. MY04]ANQ49386.1 DUF4236 domain-containing protein [Flammeovirga sp. MY04]